MSFDLQKAINGEPVYFRGFQVDICWLSKDYSNFYIVGSDDKNFIGLQFSREGRIRGSDIPEYVSTDPPKKKVSLDIYYNHNNQIEKTTGKVFYALEAGVHKELENYGNPLYLKTIEVEI